MIKLEKYLQWESSAEYLEIHRMAHSLGIPSNSTMLFGTIENIDDRLNHMDKLRNLADEYDCSSAVPYPFLLIQGYQRLN